MTITAEAVRTVVKPDDLRDALTACLLSAGKDATLPVLSTVQVEKTGAELVLRSTDRYRLTRVTIKLDDTAAQAPDFVVLVETADIKRIVAALPKPARYAVPGSVGLGMDEGSLVVTTESSTLRMQPYDTEVMGSQFPQTDRIWPTDVAAIEGIGLNPKYLIDLAKMPGRDKSEPVRFEFAGPGKPVSSRWESGDVSYEHLLMPVRVNS